MTTTFYFDGNSVLLAYRLSSHSSSSSPVRRLFTTPSNVPPTFSISTVIKLSPAARASNWCLLKVTDAANSNVLTLELHGTTSELVVQFESAVSTQVSRVDATDLFDARWHRLVISVNGRVIKWIVDCQLTGSARAEHAALAIPHDGNVYVAVQRSSRNRGVEVSIQDITYHCSPTAAEEQQCNRVRVVFYMYM